MVTAVTMWPFSWFSGSIICINDWILMYYIIIVSSFAFLWSHGHNCDRDRFLPKLVVYSGVLVVVQVRISCIQRRISCIQTCISCIQWRIFWGITIFFSWYKGNHFLLEIKKLPRFLNFLNQRDLNQRSPWFPQILFEFFRVTVAGGMSIRLFYQRKESVRSLISHSLYFIAFSNSSFMTSTPGKPVIR